jgi:hypothetical protein
VLEVRKFCSAISDLLRSNCRVRPAASKGGRYERQQFMEISAQQWLVQTLDSSGLCPRHAGWLRLPTSRQQAASHLLVLKEANEVT